MQRHEDVIKFEWDENKAILNLKKHKISFQEATNVFHDPDSVNEERFILLGMCNFLQILVVCHCYRENDSVVRIISARKANKKKQQLTRTF